MTSALVPQYPTDRRQFRRVIPRSGSRTVGYIEKQFRPDPVNSGLEPTVVSRRGFARYGVGHKQFLWKQARSAELPVGTVLVPGGEGMLINGQEKLIAPAADRDGGVSLRLFDGLLTGES